MPRRNVTALVLALATAAVIPLWSISQQVSPDEDRSGVLLQFEPEDLQTPDGRWLHVVGATVPADPRVAEYPRIAIIDSGIVIEHPQVLASTVVGQEDFTGEGIRDVLGHGTIVAILTTSAIAAAAAEAEAAGGSPRGNVAPLLVAKVARRDGTVSHFAVREAIHWAMAEGATHVNLSLGFDERFGDYSELCALIDNYNDDAVFVAAAGNSGRAIRFFPASCEGVICVVSGDDTSGPCENGGVLAPVDFELRPTRE